MRVYRLFDYGLTLLLAMFKKRVADTTSFAGFCFVMVKKASRRPLVFRNRLRLGCSAFISIRRYSGDERSAVAVKIFIIYIFLAIACFFFVSYQTSRYSRDEPLAFADKIFIIISHYKNGYRFFASILTTFVYKSLIFSPIFNKKG